MAQKKNYATKKKGVTEVSPFYNLEDINKIINYFKDREEWDNYLIFMLGLLLGRRIGDTIMVKWSDFFYENGNCKEEINTIEEQKTGKITILPVSRYVFECIAYYCSKTGIEPVKNLNEYVFAFSSKTEWVEREGNPIYGKNDLDLWCKFLLKDISEDRKKSILQSFEKQQEYKTLGEYLYYEVEYSDVVKWQTDNFRKALKRALDDNGIVGRYSCHSLRKTFGYWSKTLHPDDPAALETLMDIFNHADVSITLHYIGLSEERKRKYFNDFGDMMKNVEEGKTDVIGNNSPVDTLKRCDWQKVIKFVIESKESPLETFDKAMSMVDELSLKYV